MTSEWPGIGRARRVNYFLVPVFSPTFRLEPNRKGENGIFVFWRPAKVTYLWESNIRKFDRARRARGRTCNVPYHTALYCTILSLPCFSPRGDPFVGSDRRLHPHRFLYRNENHWVGHHHFFTNQTKPNQILSPSNQTLISDFWYKALGPKATRRKASKRATQEMMVLGNLPASVPGRSQGTSDGRPTS